MLYKDEDIKKLEDLCRPIIEFMNKKMNPNNSVVIKTNGFRIYSGHDIFVRIEDYFTDRTKKPVIVLFDSDADEMNKKYGDRYGIDWVYEQNT